jgi:hypothetical protein
MASAAAPKKWPIVPVRTFPGADQSQVRLMDQCGGLEGLPRCLHGELLGRELAQLLVDARQQLAGRVRVALRDC